MCAYEQEFPLTVLRAVKYAQERANETKTPYIVSSFGRACMDCADNRATLENLHETVIYRLSPF